MYTGIEGFQLRLTRKYTQLIRVQMFINDYKRLETFAPSFYQ